MAKVGIVTDSTACIPSEMAEKYSIELVPVVFVFEGVSYLMHGDAPDTAKALLEEISIRLNPAEIFITEFTPVIGVHTGPGIVGVAFYGE